MIDLHTHILPGMDDGAKSWEDALEMAQTAAETGTKVLAATCHGNYPGWDGKGGPQRYRERLEKFREMLRKEEIPLQVVEGMEIFASDGVVEGLKRGNLLTINRTDYVLVEFALDVRAYDVYRILNRLLEAGYRPILAHPERYLAAQRTPEHLYEWDGMGAVIQVNKGSVLGGFGEGALRTADYILRRRLACVAASDAHSPIRRTTSMEEFGRVLARRYGEVCPWLLLEENPRRILEGKNVIRKEKNCISY